MSMGFLLWTGVMLSGPSRAGAEAKGSAGHWRYYPAIGRRWQPAGRIQRLGIVPIEYARAARLHLCVLAREVTEGEPRSPDGAQRNPGFSPPRETARISPRHGGTTFTAPPPAPRRPPARPSRRNT